MFVVSREKVENLHKNQNKTKFFTSGGLLGKNLTLATDFLFLFSDHKLSPS